MRLLPTSGPTLFPFPCHFSLNLLPDKFSFLLREFDVGCEGGFEAIGERQFASGLGVSTSIWFLPLGHLGFLIGVFLFLVL